MMPARVRLILLSPVISLVLLAASAVLPPVSAQSTCADLAAQAAVSLSNRCLDLEADSACYGFAQVTAGESTFDTAGDRLRLDQPEKLQTSPADVTQSQWGLARAVMMVDSQPVNLLLAGDVSLTPDTTPGLNVLIGTKASACAETPSTFSILTPPGVTVELPVNGAVFRLTDALLSFRQPNVNNLSITVQHGQFEISSAAVPGGATVSTGQTLVAIVDNQGTILLWSAPRPATETELQTGQIVASLFNQVHTDPIHTTEVAALQTDTGAPEPITITATESTPDPTTGLAITDVPPTSTVTLTLEPPTTVAPTSAPTNTLQPVIETETVSPTATATTLPATATNTATATLEPPTATQTIPATLLPSPTVFIPTSVLFPSNPTATSGCTPQRHTVDTGQNLFRIALFYGTTVDTLIAANGIANRSLIYPGQQLIIPCTAAGNNSSIPQPVATALPAVGNGSLPAGMCAVHIVSAGENLFRIAMAYNTTVATLAAANQLANPQIIFVGNRLWIPCAR